MTPPSQPRRFWEFCPFADFNKFQWTVSYRFDDEAQQWSLRSGTRFSGIVPLQTKALEPPDQIKGVLELHDHPYSIGGFMTVADRVREFLLPWVGDTCEFVPVSIPWPKPLSSAPQYWIVNPLLTLDCWDRELSIVDWMYYDNGAHDWSVYVIDPGKVPHSSHLFRLGDHTQAIVFSDPLKRAIQKAKFRWFSWSERWTSPVRREYLENRAKKQSEE